MSAADRFFFFLLACDDASGFTSLLACPACIGQLPVERSEFDMSRLQLLNANAQKAVLSGDEAKAVASHLMANVPQASHPRISFNTVINLRGTLAA